MADFSGHEENRKKLCVVCSRLANRKKPLSAVDAKAIKEHVDNNFNSDDPDYPCALCNGCYLLLNKKRNGHDVVLKIDQKYKGTSRFLLRSSGSNCSCGICEIVLALLSDVNARVATKKKRGRPKALSTPVPRTVKICTRCFTELYPGCRHQCRTDRYREKKVENVEALIASPTSSQTLAARAIKKAVGEDFRFKSRFKSVDDSMLPTLKLATQRVAPRRLFSADDMCIIRKDLNLSSRRTLLLCEDLRAISKDRKLIEPSFKKKMIEKNHEIDDFFERTSISFYREVEVLGMKYSENFDQHVITVNNISKLIEKVIFERDLNEENVLLRIGLDGGGGFTKACMSIFDLDEEVSSSSQKKKIGKEFKDSGVKKVFIISIAQGVPEYYVNIKKMWIAAGLDHLQKRYTIATDLKLCNILLGLQNHSSMHPCCWCDIEKNCLHKVGNQRTFGSLDGLFWNYFEGGSKKTKAKLFGNVIHRSIIADIDSSTPVIVKVPPPELHLLIGPVNHMYKEMEKVWLSSESWLNSCFIKKSEYHGGSLEGNDCRKLLKNVNKLEELIPQKHHMFATAFSSFNDVVSSCYGKALAEDYKEKIRKFKEDYMQLKISVTPKVHAVFFHIQEFCDMTGMGLGPWSEQTSESLHQEFNKCWQNYIIKDQKNPLYPERLLQAVHMFNNLNL